MVLWLEPEYPNGIITEYVVSISSTEGGRQNFTVNQTDLLQLNITDLTPFTLYSVFVVGVTSEVGDRSMIVDVFTLEDGER